VQSFQNPVRIRFGWGAIDAVGDAVGDRRCAIITTEGMARRGTLTHIQAALGGRLSASFTGVEPNPTVASSSRAAEALAGTDAEVLVALGGGSSIDTAKAVAAQRAHPSTPGWLARHLREGQPFAPRFAPPSIIAIPSTAGTGSEVTMWGTIWDEQTAGKHSISHPALYPETALLDPELTLSVPRETTVASALDAVSHAMEAIWNRAANPVSDALASGAIHLIPAALRSVVAAPDDTAAREALLKGSLLAGLAISSTRTALAHSISYPLTAELGLPHGIACSITLPDLLVAVAESRPDRAGLIVDALGQASAAAGADELRALFADAGTAEVVRRHIPSSAVLGAVKGGFIAPGRAENFVLDVDQDWAADVLRRSVEAAGIAAT
jgi:phosphonate metabolism-associated iron-containing alcohol dehydrogenase